MIYNIKTKKRKRQIKICPVCIKAGKSLEEATFERQPGKSDKVWNEQICCGKNCSAIYRRKSDDDLIKPKRRVDIKPGGGRYAGYGKGSGTNNKVKR